MKSWFKIVLLILGAMIAYAVYWLALINFSVQTLTIENKSPKPITVEVYDLSWTVDADDSTVKRFRSNKGDAHFIIRDTKTREEIGSGAGYVTSSWPLCHKITISEAETLSYTTDTKSRCHLQNW